MTKRDENGQWLLAKLVELDVVFEEKPRRLGPWIQLARARLHSEDVASIQTFGLHKAKDIYVGKPSAGDGSLEQLEQYVPNVIFKKAVLEELRTEFGWKNSSSRRVIAYDPGDNALQEAFLLHQIPVHIDDLDFFG